MYKFIAGIKLMQNFYICFFVNEAKIIFLELLPKLTRRTIYHCCFDYLCGKEYLPELVS